MNFTILKKCLIKRKYCKLGDLSTHIGWNKQGLIEKLEAKRQERASDYFKRKSTLQKNISKEVENTSEVKKIKAQLKQYGY